MIDSYILILLFVHLIYPSNYRIMNAPAPPDPSTAPKISYAAINCNSLNMSTLGSYNHLLKIHGIVSLKTDIIFLSDIRLCNSSGSSNISAVTESFRRNPYCAYRLISHSNANKRGVGILIKHTLSFTVLDEYRDEEDNVLGILIDFEGKRVALCAIYGPNRVHELFLQISDPALIN
jgi:hypothetical protein